MIANYHTHTPRCNHATGSEREYVQSAIRAGLEILGFSDHAPCVFPGEYYSWHRMRMEELDDYVRSVLKLREEYKGQLEIPLGLELEYYPGLFHELMHILKEQPIDYLLLGQHFIGDEIDEPYSGDATSDAAVLERYCDQVIDGMNTGLFTYLAHPDLINYTGDEKTYIRHMRRLCREAKDCGIPLEWNLLGMTKGRNYPDIRFWELAAEEGCDVILGWDAHKPQSMEDSRTLNKAMEMIRGLDLKIMETVPLRKI